MIMILESRCITKSNEILSLVFGKNYQNNVRFCIKQAEISANGVQKIILIQILNKIIFITPLADISACFMQKLTLFFFRK